MRRSEPILSRLLDGARAKLTFIDYPVAPESGYKDTVKGVQDSYIFLSNKYVDDKFVLVGESAGGGLALVLAQTIGRNLKVRNPEKLVLFSPWLDLSMENTGIADLEKADMILSKKALHYAAGLYTDSSDLKNPLVSPIYGDFNELGDTLMFFGSFEMFYADGIKMQEIAKERKLDIHFRFYQEMHHCWVIFPLPEAHVALQEAIDFILR